MIPFIIVFDWSVLPNWLDAVLILAGGWGMMKVLIETCDHMDRMRVRRNGGEAWW